MENNTVLEKISDGVKALGAFKTAVIDSSSVVTSTAFRDMCKVNSCGVYGKCWMCPPDVGEIDELMNSLKNYKHAFVYQTVSELEDSYDFEGMIAAKKNHAAMSQKVRAVFAESGVLDALHLGVGGCGVCERCTKPDGQPCRYPDKAMPSLEAYGVNVSELAKASGMKYINGQDTVTYFGAVFFNL